jgi:F1F0 ATPase subunit 2
MEMDAQAMTAPHLAAEIPALVGLAFWLAAGALIGAIYFWALQWNARLFAAGPRLPAAFALQLARFAVLGGALALVAVRFGALPLLVATAGLLLARTAVIRMGTRQ